MRSDTTAGERRWRHARACNFASTQLPLPFRLITALRAASAVRFLTRTGERIAADCACRRSRAHDCLLA